MQGAKNDEHSDAMCILVKEDREDHMLLFGHDEYYKFIMWIKFEKDNDHFNVYDNVLSATKWLIDIIS